MISRTLTALALASVCSAASAAAIYKYVDPQGRAYYTDQAKPGWQRIDLKPPATGEAAAVEEKEGETETREQAMARAADCARKDEQLKSYRGSSRIIERDALGREREYSEEERRLLIERTEQEVQACRQPAQAADSTQ